MDLFQEGYQSLFVNDAVLVSQGFILAKFLQHVVHVRDRQAGMQSLLPLAVGIERLAEFAIMLKYLRVLDP